MLFEAATHDAHNSDIPIRSARTPQLLHIHDYHGANRGLVIHPVLLPL